MGLEHAIGVSFADPIRDVKGWAFRDGNGHGPDEAEGFSFLSEAYRATDASFNGRITVPVLWDRKDRRIVNNSEDDICRLLSSDFRPLAKHAVNLFPEDLTAEQAALSATIYERINNGVYRAGFATTQDAYEDAYNSLFEALGTIEELLSQGGPYLFRDRIVETDWRLFCTLLRFDAVYHGHFKCNKTKISEYFYLQNYLEQLYRRPGIAETVNFDHIKRHYYVTHDDINPTGIVPCGPHLDWIKATVF
jgi:putative glutathione S-transferase